MIEMNEVWFEALAIQTITVVYSRFVVMLPGSETVCIFKSLVVLIPVYNKESRVEYLGNSFVFESFSEASGCSVWNVSAKISRT